MLGRSGIISLVAMLALFVAACQPTAPAPPAPDDPAAPAPEAPAPADPAAPSRVTIAVTETVETHNPYADSVSLMYGIWCEIYGCLVGYDFDQGDYVGQLAESWDVEDPNTWIFNLRQNVQWHDGSDFTADDVVHSFDRIANDPDSRQTQNIAPVASVEKVDDHTVRIVTDEPTSNLVDYFSDRLIVTNKQLFDQHGDAVYREAPIGTGPYMFQELLPDQRMTIIKNPNWWGGQVEGPDEVVYRVMREPEVRVTALLNNEIQIAQFVPPHMADRVEGSATHKIIPVESIEIMFLAMQPVPPFDNKLVRQAVAHAIDRDTIIDSVLMGYAQRLDGPIGPGQYGFSAEVAERIAYPYDPDRARELLAEAGFPDGVDVELSTPVGRYTLDREISEAVAQMLTQVGIRTTLLAPEWSTLWDDVQRGRVPFYYMGRGSVLDPGLPLHQYFETGGSPRIGYSNPELDELFARQRAAFDPAERQEILQEIFAVLTEEAPAHFMWRHQLLYGMSENIDFEPRPDARMYANDVRVR